MNLRKLSLNQSIPQIFEGLVLTDEEVILIESRLDRVFAKKGERLVEIGNNVDCQYFIISGCLRSFYVDKNGKEHTAQFGIYDWWISDYTAFFSQEKAIMNVEVIKDADLLKISIEDLNYLYKAIPKIETFFRKRAEWSCTTMQKRILSYLSLNASERYLSFLNDYPEVEQNVKNYHIASYLGITTESLSRIRKELSRA